MIPNLQPGIEKGQQMIKPAMAPPRAGSTIRKSTGGMRGVGSEELYRNQANSRADIRRRNYDLEDDARDWERGEEERQFQKKKRKQFFKLAKREEADWEDKKANLKQDRLLKAQEQYANLLNAEERSVDNSVYLEQVDEIRAELGRERASFEKNLTTGVISMIAEAINSEDDQAIDQLQKLSDGMFGSEPDIEDLTPEQLNQLANKVALLAKGTDTMAVMGTFTERVKGYFDTQIQNQEKMYVNM